MKLLKNIICASVLMVTVATLAQQDPNYSLYRYNMNLVNPAYAGAHEGSELGLNFRSQWAGVDGAPETQSIFFGAPVGKNLGLGVSIINDRTFIENQTSIAIDVSYRLKVDVETFLYFGIKAGANSYNVNTSGLVTFGVGADPSLSNLDGGFTPNIGAGAYLKGNRYFVSLSMPRLLVSDRLENLNGTAQLGRNRLHMYASAGYDIKVSDGFEIKPSALLRYVNAAPLSIDLTTGLEFNQRFEIGAAYRLNEGLGGYALIKFADWADAGYVYQNSVNNPVSLGSNGTHEIFMKFKL